MYGPIYFLASLPHCGGPNLSSNATFHSTMTGWQSSLLNQMGRAVLVNSVLNSQLIYAMAALEIPPGIIDQVDRKRRSFLWSGSGTATGSRSMVAWQHVCDTKDMGGLGLKDLGIQNTCLLLKMIQATLQQCFVMGKMGTSKCLHGSHWDTLRSLLPLYRAITTVNLMDGTTTSFWHDVWNGHDSLAERFPELLSHCRNQEITVKRASL